MNLFVDTIMLKADDFIHCGWKIGSFDAYQEMKNLVSRKGLIFWDLVASDCVETKFEF
jgi:hypothetical protein